MKTARWTLAAASLCLALTAGRAADLKLGDPAPKLALKEFVKGEPVKELEAGKTYVVEFWATWCGPCKASIPHVTELSKQYKDVVFIGVDVWEKDVSKVKPFVAEMGEKMGYRVATDDGDAMAKTWMAAAGRNGIPCAFVINSQSKVAWIGHPMTMAEPLEKITKGTWDIAAAAAAAEKEEAAKAKQKAIMDAFGKAKEPAAKAKILRDWWAEEPAAEARTFSLMLRALNTPDTQADYLAYAKKCAEMFATNANSLQMLALNIASPLALGKNAPKVDPALEKLALDALIKADELFEKKNAICAAYLGMAYRKAGNFPKAIETLERAVKLADGQQYVKTLQKWLDETKAAADAGTTKV